MDSTWRQFARTYLLRLCAVLVACLVSARGEADESSDLQLKANDVVAFMGGADVAAAQFTGHLEALFAVQYASLGIRCRNFGWEGDTVFSQPRDVGFPPLKVHLQRAGATVIVLQYGRSEALLGETNLAHFLHAYDRMLDEFSKQTTRLVLVTPPPFENGGGYLPDMSVHNAELASYCTAIVNLSRRRNLPVVDLFSALGGAKHREEKLTSDGLQLTPRGQGLAAVAFAKAAGFGRWVSRAGKINLEGRWSNASLEAVRQAVLTKDRLWFNYWRPQNWAFLGGDRTEQPSSRDYRDPRIRWFPAEMEKYLPMIHDADAKVQESARTLKP